ncbi:MAG: efflux RND transporter permease subunit [Sedimentisphaerales bacterium]|nr:efflux RND transporter permease subunit [Sedimentisphaerales bacterium]
MPDELIVANEKQSLLDKVIAFSLTNRLVVVLVTAAMILGGIAVAPFDWNINWLPRSPVPVDAIPDIGENQQIVFTEWMGRSPQDIEDQVTYPLSAALSGVPRVKSIRGNSMFGFSSIYVIFEEDADFDWSRAKLIERLNSLPAGTLPEGVRPSLGPDATALGQVFWYTLEGYDPEGKPAGGWDPQELRSIQDWTVRYALQSAQGVAEVASVGGFVKEYQIDVDPDAMQAAQVTLPQVFMAIRASNRDVGARTIEMNSAEYVVRGIGFVKSLEDLENVVLRVSDNVPILLKNIAHVSLGPALRRGALDKAGAEAVGGVVVVRYGENPLKAIQNVKAKIEEIASGLPKKNLADGTISQVRIVPFYDRTGLIYETLGTLNDAIGQEIIVTIIVVMVMLRHIRSSALISGLLPLAVLACFIAMRLFKVDANIVALSGIAIAIGTIVDIGIVICENIVRHLAQSDGSLSRRQIIYNASSEVASAVLTAVATTIVSFLPVFTMSGAEGKLFKPLAYTKTFALLASVIVAITIIPPLAYTLYRRRKDVGQSESRKHPLSAFFDYLLIGVVLVILSRYWRPLGPDRGLILNLIFVIILLGWILLLMYVLRRFYTRILAWCLDHKILFLSIPAAVMISGVMIWRSMGKEFMPALDEGSFLYMPTTMPHASIGEALDVLAKLDKAIQSIPEVDQVVGKIGRADSALDPAPISMVETVINYKPKYKTDRDGRYVLDDKGKVIRQWREGIETPQDIWNEIVKAAQLPGTTSAPKLQPIETRLVMLQTGMRAPMGVKVKGHDLQTMEEVGLRIEELLKQVEGVEPSAVFADRIIGKPYLEIHIDRAAIARYGLRIDDVQNVIEIAVGGKQITTTVEGRERYPVRVRYPRELRSDLDTLGDILVPSASGEQIPLVQMAEIEYVRGPQSIKSEDTFLVGYVLFDKKPDYAEVDVVQACQQYLKEHLDPDLPPGIHYVFSGTYENQIRAQKTLMTVIPAALFVIFLILYFQFKKVSITFLVFIGVFVAWSGGFLMLWFYGQDWFLNVSLFGVHLRELFNIHTYNLSVAVWVGFLALFGIATDDGVLMATYLNQRFAAEKPQSISEIRKATVAAASKRVRPALMTTATTILALLPVLTSTGRGSDVMVPMAIPSFGGMTLEILTILVTPVLYCLLKELNAGKS